MAASEQPDPTRQGQKVDIATLVKQDIEARIVMGEKKYGERLSTNNGRDALMDLYQELLDGAGYIRQLIFERDGK